MLHSFHLAHVAPTTTLRAWGRVPGRVSGLRHAEALAGMVLGAPVVSLDRMQLPTLAMFCAWDDEAALDRFLTDDRLGTTLAQGWHVRLQFLRRWGRVAELADLPAEAGPTDLDEPVVAFTLARTRLPETARFIRWGRPVERLVRDHPATTLALAGMRPPRTVATFSVWRSARDMTGMVHGRGEGEGARRHAEADAERRRRDFHHEFTTLRFRPLAERGTWQGRTGIVPT